MIKHYIELLCENKLSLSIKNLIGKHIVKVRYFMGLNLECANERFYEERFYQKANYTNEIFKVKKKWVFKRDSLLNCIVIYATMNNREKVDNDL